MSKLVEMKPAEKFRPGKTVTVNDCFQRNYRYKLVAPLGEGFDSAFEPHFSPSEMLAMGVFEGKYLNDCTAEFPAEWFSKARIATKPNPELNYFGIKSRQPLS
jgi:hypothetical protein